MQMLSWDQINQAAVAHVNKWAVYVSNGLPYDCPQDDECWRFVQDQIRSIYGDQANDILLHLISRGMFFFDTEQQQQQFYRIFEQPLIDSSAIYACTYDPQGQGLTENT